MAKVHSENAPGPFYVEEGCCLSCGVPIDVAPQNFDWARDGSHCIVKCQPETPGELDGVIVAICRAEVDCIRYRGDDREIARRIAESGHGDSCDTPLAGTRAKLRSRVVFTSSRPDDSPEALAERLRASLADSDWTWTDVKPIRFWDPATVVYAWDKGLFRRAHYNKIRFEAARGTDRFRASLRHGYPGAGVGLALSIHDWLMNTERVGDAHWYAADEDWESKPGFHMPV